MAFDIRDPDNKLYVCCTFASVAVMLAAAVVSVAYLAVKAPDEAYILSTGENAVGLWTTVFCTIVFLVCLALLLKDAVKRLRSCPTEERDARFMRSPLSKAGMLLAVNIAVTVPILLVSDMIGMEVTEDFIGHMSDYEMMASMMEAGPLEEFSCRILLIGVPVMLVCLLKGHKGCFKNVFGGFGMSRTALFFLVVSSLVFGLMHLDGWTVMKVPQTFASGMMFGYVFIQYGAHASIVMHSTFDMMASFDYLMAGTGTVPLMFLTVVGLVLLVRSLFKIRSYIPDNNLHEPFEGNLIEMWERDRGSRFHVGRTGCRARRLA